MLRRSDVAAERIEGEGVDRAGMADQLSRRRGRGVLLGVSCQATLGFSNVRKDCALILPLILVSSEESCR